MKILLFGATGSIGTQLLDVLEQHQLVGISFNKNIKKAQEIITKYNLKHYLCHSNDYHSSVKDEQDLISQTSPDLIVNAIVGYAGLKVTILAIKNKIDLALANKESLVIAGKLIDELNQNQIKILPIDSEHSSLYQLTHQNNAIIDTLYITCSGGSCYNKTNEELKNISYAEVIKHPNWNMGEKISIDSATLMNKCFEIIEAYWLFKIKNIKAILHPQSIVHAMVKFIDHSFLMYASSPDMRLPIKLAINKFNNISTTIKPLDFSNLKLDFNEIDLNKHLPIQWAYEVINDENNSLGLIINVANEIAIDLFKQEKINFLEIIPFIDYYKNMYKDNKIKNFDELFYLLDKILSSNYEQIIQIIKNHR